MRTTQDYSKATLANKKVSELYPHAYLDDRIHKVTLLLPITAESYLDVGCSDGTVTKYLADKLQARERCGLDVANVSQAKNKGITAEELDLNQDLPFPYPSDHFNVVTCLDTLEHVFNTDFVVSEIFRVLRPSGAAIISVPRTDSLVNILLLIMGFQMMSGSSSLERNYGAFSDNRISGHLSHFTKRALVEICQFHGFKVTTYVEATAVGAWFGDLVAVNNKIGLKNRLLGKIISKIPIKKEISIIKVVKK